MSPQKILFVQTITLKAMEQNPALKVPEFVRELVRAMDNDDPVAAQVKQRLPAEEPMRLPDVRNQSAPAQLPVMSAPFPQSAMGSGDVPYDPIGATAVLPPFDKLVRSWCSEYSAIRIDDQTVVLNSAHYDDLLYLRQRAVDCGRFETLANRLAAILDRLNSLVMQKAVMLDVLQASDSSIRVIDVANGDVIANGVSVADAVSKLIVEPVAEEPHEDVIF